MDGGSTGSMGTDLRGSGVTPRWISNSADGMHGNERVEMLMEPFQWSLDWLIRQDKVKVE